MARQARIDYPGSLHHIMVRGMDRRDLFTDPAEKRYFLDRMGNVLEESKTLCHAFCLMSNHVHLLLVTGEARISRVMQSLLTGYAIYFNRKHRRNGKLYQNRFKSVLCEKETYFLQLVRYIHLNPVRAGILPALSELDRSPWTGHAVLMGREKAPWFDTEEVLSHFGGRVKKAREEYRKFMEEGMSEGRREDLRGGGLIRSLGGLWEAVKAGRKGKRQSGDERILGSGAFVEEVLRSTEERESRQGRLRREGWNYTRVRDRICRLLGIEITAIESRGHGNAVSRARALLCKWMIVDMGYTQTEAARQLRISRQAVSQSAVRGRELEIEMGIGLEGL